MIFELEYKKVVELDANGVQHFYLLFNDSANKVQKVEVDKAVCEEVMSQQAHDESAGRKARRYCVSLDEMDYEGEVFSTIDPALVSADDEDNVVVKRVNMILSEMKPKQAEILKALLIDNMNQAEYGALTGRAQSSVSERLALAVNKFKMLYLERFGSDTFFGDNCD